MFFGYLRDQFINILEHLAIKRISFVFRSIGIDGSMNEVQLLLEDTVRGLLGERFNNDFNELMGSHFGVFYHLEETSPN